MPEGRLEDCVGDESTLGQFFEHINGLSETVDERDEAILATQYGHADATFLSAP